MAYFERLATSDPGRWAARLSVARAFATLVEGPPPSSAAQSLLARARELGEDGGTAWHELLLALEVSRPS